MVWNPFRRYRNDMDTGTVPSGVQEYYQSERGERMGVAWLIAFVSLIVTILVVLLLFFGGRWIYRKITNHNKSTTAPTSQTSNSNVGNNSGNTSTGNNNTPGGSGQPAQNPSQNNTTSPTTGPSTTPATGDTTEIPRTGPETDE